MKKRLAIIIGKIFIAIYKIRYGKRVSFGKNVIIGPKFSLHGKGRLIVGENSNLWCHKEPFGVHFTSVSASLRRRPSTSSSSVTHEQSDVCAPPPIPTIIIGANCRINGASFFCREKIEVGHDTMIASAMLIDTDFHSTDPNHRNDPEYIKTSAIKIGDHVWIAGQAAILKGVTVGDNTTIGFRAVVASPIPANVIAAGNPARVIKSLGEGE
jgi:acetyltransferase-like isoleucine patch superfamily enzyme